MQKTKRTRKDKIIIGVTALMVAMCIVVSMLYAFHKPLLIYKALCALSLGWCMAFAVANGGEER